MSVFGQPLLIMTAGQMKEPPSQRLHSAIFRLLASGGDQNDIFSLCGHGHVSTSSYRLSETKNNGASQGQVSW